MRCRWTRRRTAYRSSCVPGLLGEVSLDEKADRIPVFAFWQYRPGLDAFEVAAYVKLNQPNQVMHEQQGLLSDTLVHLV